MSSRTTLLHLVSSSDPLLGDHRTQPIGVGVSSAHSRFERSVLLALPRELRHRLQGVPMFAPFRGLSKGTRRTEKPPRAGPQRRRRLLDPIRRSCHHRDVVDAPRAERPRHVIEQLLVVALHADGVEDYGNFIIIRRDGDSVFATLRPTTLEKVRTPSSRARFTSALRIIDSVRSGR